MTHDSVAPRRKHAKRVGANVAPIEFNIPLEPIAVQTLARRTSEEAVITLRKIMLDENAPASSRVTAALALLERGNGKVAAQVKTEHTDMTALHLAAMKAHLAARQQGDTAQVIDNVEVSS